MQEEAVHLKGTTNKSKNKIITIARRVENIFNENCSRDDNTIY